MYRLKAVCVYVCVLARARVSEHGSSRQACQTRSIQVSGLRFWM